MNTVLSFLNWLTPETYQGLNFGKRRIYAVAAGNVGASSDIDNVEDFRPLVTLDFDSSDFRHTWLRLGLVDDAVSLPWRLMGLVGLSELIPGQSQYRFVAAPSVASPTQERLFPTGTVTTTNVTVSTGGSAHSVLDDDPWAASADYVRETTPGSATVLNVSFATPAATPVTGAKMQAFVLRVAPHAAAGVGKTYTVSLYEGGSLVLALGTIDGQAILDIQKECVFAFYWNASLLGTASGANVECRIDGPSGSADTSLRFYSCAWIVDEASYSSAEDTGWLTVPSWHLEPSTGVNLAGFGTPPLRKLEHVLSTARTTDTGWLFMLRQAWDGAQTFDRQLGGSEFSNSGEWGGVEDNPRIGVAWVGPGWEPSRRNASRAGSYARINSIGGDVQRSAGGQPFGSNGVRFRGISPRWEGLTSDEAFGLQEVLIRRGGLGPMWLVLEPGQSGAVRRQAGSLYGLVKDVGAPVDYGKGYERFSLTFGFDEFV